MEAKTHSPNFTVSLRGYDREEVDEYLDSLAEALGRVEDAEEHNRRLQTHIAKLNNRVKELEDRARLDTPKTGAALGERIGTLLRSAEDAAAETVAAAETAAAAMEAEANKKVADAEETVRQAVQRGEEQARRIEIAARGEAEQIVSEAETRANLRTRQIEQWAEQVVAHTRAEEVRMLKEQQEKRKAAAAELEELAKQRRSSVAILHELRASIDGALGIANLDPGPLSEPSLSGADAPATVARADDEGAPTPAPADHSADATSVVDLSGDALEGRTEADSEDPGRPFERPSFLDDGYVVEPITSEIELRDIAMALNASDDNDVEIDDWISGSGGSRHAGQS